MPNSANFLQGFPPQHNFLPPQGGGGGVQYTTNGDNIQNRSLPPVPPGESPYHSDPHYPSAPGISTLPSRASFASNQSAESSRSLSPPDGPCTGPPPIPQTHPNISVVVAGNGTAPEQDNPSSFQEQLMSRIRLHSLSNEVPTASSSLARSQENIYSLPAFTTPLLPRASNSMSASASARTGPPPVSSKPARPPTVASKPSRAGYLQTGQLLTSKMCSCISLLHVHYCHVYTCTCTWKYMTLYMCIYNTLALRNQNEKKGEVNHPAKCIVRACPCSHGPWLSSSLPLPLSPSLSPLPPPLSHSEWALSSAALHPCHVLRHPHGLPPSLRATEPRPRPRGGQHVCKGSAGTETAQRSDQRQIRPCHRQIGRVLHRLLSIDITSVWM